MDGHPVTDDVQVVALIEAACRSSGLLWIVVGSATGRPAWHEWSDGAAYVVHARDAAGAEEQVVPGLADADQVDVSVRGDKQGRVLTWRARVTHLQPGTGRWDDAVALLRPGRLNATDPNGVAARWADTCDVCALTPTGELVERPGDYRQDAGSAPPPPSPATTTTGRTRSLNA